MMPDAGICEMMLVALRKEWDMTTRISSQFALCDNKRALFEKGETMEIIKKKLSEMSIAPYNPRKITKEEMAR